VKRILFGTVFIAVAVLVTATLLFQIQATPSLKSVRDGFRSSDRAILDRNGQVIDEVRVEKKVRRLNWVELKEVTPAFIAALLKAEDKRFYYHPGVDVLALSKATLGKITRRSDRGASTISMQLTELVEKRSTRGRRTVAQKIRQIFKAVALEMSWSKEEILEAYINLIQYRSELQGLSAASFGLFDKSPSALTRGESAVIVALIRAPNAGVERVRSRACRLLTSMGSPSDCALLTPEHLSYVEQGYRIRPFMRMAPFIAKKLAANKEANKGDGLIRSTLDRGIQWVAIHSLQRKIAGMKDQNMGDGAIVVIENSTGNILAYVGNIGKGSKGEYVDAASSMRQAGSTLKPLIFAKAIDERILTAATVLEDSPMAISVTTGLYRPANFDKSFRNMVTVRAALGASLNIPAVRALELVGVDTFVETMAQLGFSNLQRADFYGPSLALGSADVKLIELANAYRTLANKGMWSPVRFSPDILSTEAPRRVYSEEAAFIMTTILSDREARASTFGLSNSLSTTFFTAVKTGTSQDMRDNWTVGFSEKYTVAVWAGNQNGDAMWNVSGVQGAAPVWQEVMMYLHSKQSSQAPIPPATVVQKDVFFEHTKQRRTEWFIAGTEPATENVHAKEETRTAITYPLDKTMIAMDPDIPEKNHRMFIQVSAPDQDHNVYLNGRRLGRAQAMLAWTPEPGKFELELRDSEGHMVDKVQFEVRGPRMASAKKPVPPQNL
jgi:penicillin-binding protein 1C